VTFGYSGTQSWPPECPNVKNKKCRLRLDGKV